MLSVLWLRQPEQRKIFSARNFSLLLSHFGLKAWPELLTHMMYSLSTTFLREHQGAATHRSRSCRENNSSRNIMLSALAQVARNRVLVAVCRVSSLHACQRNRFHSFVADQNGAARSAALVPSMYQINKIECSVQWYTNQLRYTLVLF